MRTKNRGRIFLIPEMEIILNSGIWSVKGILSLGENIGIKRDKKDFAVIFSEKLANAAGMFTKNRVKGAPIIVDIEKLKSGKAQAIVINSGISNVCTGQKGIDDAYEMAKLAADELGINEEHVLVSSTGVIGAYLPMEKIREGINGIKSRLKKSTAEAAEAILTTDLIPKNIAVKFDGITIGAIAKGSGMVNPNMATMLVFITTDAEISSEDLKKFLKNSVDKSFNMVTVDNDTSTSDSVIILANGLAGKPNTEKFQNALDYVCIELAKKIARDGEGATKLIEIKVKNAVTFEQAKKIAKSIAGSNLVKCAMFGNDPNWGRIMCAAGYADTEDKNFHPEKVDIIINSEKIVINGESARFDKPHFSELLKADPVVVEVDLKLGKEEATAYGCDMSYDYVKINAEYHT